MPKRTMPRQKKSGPQFRRPDFLNTNLFYLIAMRRLVDTKKIAPDVSKTPAIETTMKVVEPVTGNEPCTLIPPT